MNQTPKSNALLAILCIAISLNACAAQPEKSDPSVIEKAVTGPVETFFEGCKTELDRYCAEVTPGDNRLLACIYSHEDKLSTRCEYALYDAASQLERAVSSLSYIATECRDDLEKYCANIEPGKGRLLACIDKNDSKVSGRCKQALKDVGVRK
jgi:Cysteine rich repeat